jgi:hypothetical protein
MLGGRLRPALKNVNKGGVDTTVKGDKWEYTAGGKDTS